MKHSKKIVASTASLLLALSLGACSTANTKPGGETTLHVLSFGLDRAPHIFDKFTKETGIKVVDEQVGTADYPAVLQTRVAGKADVDVINYTSGAVANKYAAAKTFVDISKNPLLKNVAAGSVDAGVYKGKNYGFAAGAYVVGVYYNQEIFKSLGIAIPTNWEQFKAAAEKIKTSGNGVAPVVLSSAEGWTNQYIYHAAVAKYSKDHPKFMADLQSGNAKWSENPLFVKQVDRYQQIADAGYFLPGGASLKFGDGQAAFASGKAAMWIMGSWGLGGLTPAGFTPGAFPLPFNSAAQKPAVSSSLFDNMFAVTSWSKKKDAALKLLAYMSTDEFGAQFQKAQGQKSASLNVKNAPYSPYQADWDVMFDAAIAYPLNMGPSVNGDGPNLLGALLQPGGDAKQVISKFQDLQLADNNLGY